MVTPPDIEVQILRYYHAEKWTIGTIARQLHVHHSPRVKRPGAGSTAMNSCDSGRQGVFRLDSMRLPDSEPHLMSVIPPRQSRRLASPARPLC